MAQRAVVWIRNDQRIFDNEILHRAAQLSGPSVILYCFDPRHFATTPYGSKKTGAFRAKFLVESISDLRQNLRRIGADLLVGLGRPEDVIPQVSEALLASNSSVTPTVPKATITTSCEENAPLSLTLMFQKEYAYEEECVEKGVQEALKKQFGASGRGMKCHIDVQSVDGATLYNKADVPYKSDLSDLGSGHTAFIKKTDSWAPCVPRAMFPTPKKGALKVLSSEDIPSHDNLLGYDFLPTDEQLGFTAGSLEELTASSRSKAVAVFTGGETPGRARVQQWMFDGDNLKTYFDTRNGMLGDQASSKFSPWLANGNLSPRFIKAECSRYEKERQISNKSTYWLVYEMLVRDYMHFLVQKGGRSTFFSGGMSGKPRQWSMDEEKIQRWKTGSTGVPLVDANMRELAATGWMSNRGRQNVASYLVHDLGIDWRVGADHFESLLLDHDVYSNYGNWNAAAGLTGGRINRFNMFKQSQDYDPEGNYIRHWLPELGQLPAPRCFKPIGVKNYPAPGDPNRGQSGADGQVPKEAKISRQPDAAERHWEYSKERKSGGKKKTKSRLQ